MFRTIVLKSIFIVSVFTNLQDANAQENFKVPPFRSSVSPPSTACGFRDDPKDDLRSLEEIQEVVREVNKLVPQLPPGEDAYIRAQMKLAYSLLHEGKSDSFKIAREEAKRRPFYLAWDVRDNASRVQNEIAMQHGYENSRKLNPNVDALQAQQALALIDTVRILEKSVRTDLKKVALPADKHKIEALLIDAEMAITRAILFVGCKNSRTFHSKK